ncbi:MAG: transposase [Rikenellaceae bacterium]
MRKRHTAEFKTKVAIEAVKGLKTINEIAAHFEVAPTQVSAWKKQFLEASAETFKAPKHKKESNNQANVDNLYRKIGQLEVENEFLKKSGNT